MTLKTIELVTAEGKRAVKVANATRKASYEHIMSVLEDAGLAPVVAANGDIAIPTCIDATTGDTYYTRLSVSLSAKPLDSKVAKKVKAAAEPVVIDNLFE